MENIWFNILIDPMTYWYMLMGVVVITVLYINANASEKQVLFPNTFFALLIAVCAISMMASKPAGFGVSYDRENYAMSVINAGVRPLPEFSLGGEYVFSMYTYICGHIMNYQTWFWLTATIYVMNYFWAARRLSKDNMVVVFVIMLCSISFYAYGVNTIRAGLASSFLILAASYYYKPVVAAGLMFISLCIHTSMSIPIMVMILAYFYNNPKMYIWAWLVCIVLSYYMGSYWEGVFAGYDTLDRTVGYLDNGKLENVGYNRGFRWDFLAYSAVPILLGYIYIYKLEYESKIYSFIYCTYTLTNAFWVLVIRANYTDRFAFLSWMFMQIVMTYPLLDRKVNSTLVAQSRNISYIVVGAFLFGFAIAWKYNM